MTNNEIIKALECCSNNPLNCRECGYKGRCHRIDCYDYLKRDALDLINRQQAEIERLQNLTEKDFEQTAISTVKRHQKWIEYRAIKEFAERLKENANSRMYRKDVVYIVEIDNLVKEMVDDTE